MTNLDHYKKLAGLDYDANGLTEAVVVKAKKKDKKAKLTEADVDAKKAKAMKKAKMNAVCEVAKGNQSATEVGKMRKSVMEQAKAHFGDKKIARKVTEAILYKKLAAVKAAISEQEVANYFKEFDTLMEKVVDTQMGAKSLHGQYDPTIDGNMYKDSKSTAEKVGKGAAYKSDDKWKSYNEKARDKGVSDGKDSDGKPGDRQPVAGQDAAFVDGNEHPSTQNKLGEDASGAKKAIEAASKSDAGDKAKDAIKKGSYGAKSEGFDLAAIRKIAGIDPAVSDTVEMFVVTEAATGKIECMFPKYEEASKWLAKMKKPNGTYNVEPKKFSRGFHFKKSDNGGYTTDAK